jgi:hypothetical protein
LAVKYDSLAAQQRYPPVDEPRQTGRRLSTESVEIMLNTVL